MVIFTVDCRTEVIFTVDCRTVVIFTSFSRCPDYVNFDDDHHMQNSINYCHTESDLGW